MYTSIMFINLIPSTSGFIIELIVNNSCSCQPQTSYNATKRIEVICPWMLANIINSLAPRLCGSNVKSVISKHMTRNSNLGARYEIALSWMLENFTNEKPTLVSVMAWYNKPLFERMLTQISA